MANTIRWAGKYEELCTIPRANQGPLYLSDKLIPPPFAFLQKSSFRQAKVRAEQSKEWVCRETKWLMIEKERAG